MRKRNFTLSLLGSVALAAGTLHVAAEPQTLSVELVSTFDYPRPAYSLFQSGQINDKGQFVGVLQQGSAILGFTGSAAGSFSRPLAEPRDVVGYTVANGINNTGLVCGSYDANVQTHGFFRHGTTFRTYDVPVTGVSATTVQAVNDSGDFVGEYVVSQSVLQAYANIGGNLITIPISGTFPDATGINNLGQVVGSYGDGSGKYYGFMRATDGTLTFPIAYPGSSTTIPAAINDSGYTVGYWVDNHGVHAFVFQSPSTYLTYDVAGAKATYFSGINSAGLICGTYQDQQNKTHGLIAQLQGQ